MDMHVGEVPLAYARVTVIRGDASASLSAQRFVDCLICILTAPFAVIVGVLISVLIRLDGGPAVYSQLRVGLGGRPFSCLKFRSMVRDADQRLESLLARDAAVREEWGYYQKLGSDPRITWIGRFIRSFSLDELPQLLNVWRGEMSIVGPRPIMADQIALYGEGFRTYCGLRPGITGLWQVEGRSNCTFADRVRLDMQYARSRSMLQDLRIIVLTVPAVFARRGAR